MLSLVAKTRCGQIGVGAILTLVAISCRPSVLPDAEGPPADVVKRPAVEPSPALARELQKLSKPLDPETFRGILDALREHGDEVESALPEVIRVIPRLSPCACEQLSRALGAAGVRIAQPLAVYARDENPRIRFVAIRTLGELENWEGRDGHLIAALDDPSATVRGAAVDGLRRNAPKEAYDPLNRLLENESESSDTRSAAALTLAFIDPVRAVATARGLVESEDTTLRIAAYRILGYANDVDTLIDAARRPVGKDAVAQRMLVGALVFTRDEKAKKILTQMLNDPKSFENLQVEPSFIREAIEAIDTGRWPERPRHNPEDFPL